MTAMLFLGIVYNAIYFFIPPKYHLSFCKNVTSSLPDRNEFFENRITQRKEKLGMVYLEQQAPSVVFDPQRWEALKELPGDPVVKTAF